MRGAVLAGVWGAGKTTVMRRCAVLLAERPCDHLIVIPQAASVTTHTYTSCPVEEQMAALLGWFEHLTRHLEIIDEAWRASTLPGHRFAGLWEPIVLMEGLGFDVPVHGLPLSRENLLAVEDRLARLGLLLFVLTVAPDDVQEQCVRSTREHRSERWATYLDGFGPDDTARAEHVAAAQQRLLGWARGSALPLTILRAGPESWEGSADAIVTTILEARTTRAIARPSRPTG